MKTTFLKGPQMHNLIEIIKANKKEITRKAVGIACVTAGLVVFAFFVKDDPAELIVFEETEAPVIDKE